MSGRFVLTISLLFGAAAVGITGCQDLSGQVTNGCSDQVVFEQNVSPFLERRCGTLDCHGGIARPMRIFGGLGLRHPDENNFPGGVATTPVELVANYTSVCGVDAEKMSESKEQSGNTAEKLLIVTKARGLENHKGGKVVNENDPGDLCILSWLRNNEAQAATQCKAAVDALTP